MEYTSPSICNLLRNKNYASLLFGFSLMRPISTVLCAVLCCALCCTVLYWARLD